MNTILIRKANLLFFLLISIFSNTHEISLISRRNVPKWVSFPSEARAVDIAAVEDQIWIVGENGQVYQLNTKTNDYINSNTLSRTMMNGALRISVGVKDYPWICSKNGQIWRLTSAEGNRSWRQVTGCCKDIARSADNAFIVTCEATRDGNFKIAVFDTDDAWIDLGFDGYRIATNYKGEIYLAKHNLDVYRINKKGEEVKILEIKANDIAVGNHLVYIGEHKNLYIYNKKPINMEGLEPIAVTVGKQLWVIDKFGKVVLLEDSSLEL